MSNEPQAFDWEIEFTNSNRRVIPRVTRFFQCDDVFEFYGEGAGPVAVCPAANVFVIRRLRLSATPSKTFRFQMQVDEGPQRTLAGVFVIDQAPDFQYRHGGNGADLLIERIPETLAEGKVE